LEVNQYWVSSVNSLDEEDENRELDFVLVAVAVELWTIFLPHPEAPGDSCTFAAVLVVVVELVLFWFLEGGGLVIIPLSTHMA
jgi:hypothetical protein